MLSLLEHCQRTARTRRKWIENYGRRHPPNEQVPSDWIANAEKWEGFAKAIVEAIEMRERHFGRRVTSDEPRNTSDDLCPDPA